MFISHAALLQCCETTGESSKWHEDLCSSAVQQQVALCLLEPSGSRTAQRINNRATGFHFCMPENGMKSTPQLPSSSIMHPRYRTNCIVFARIISTMIPRNFSSVGLRNRVAYKDLSDVELTDEEKTFLANEALGITQFLTWDNEEFSIVQRICNRFLIPNSSMTGWKERVEKGKIITDTVGRPPSMDAEAGASSLQL